MEYQVLLGELLPQVQDVQVVEWHMMPISSENIKVALWIYAE